MKIYDDILQTVGSTPIVRLSRLVKNCGLEGELLGKIESFNPCGSVKDRVAITMVEEAEKSGKLKTGGVIIEPTSGNTGIGLASVCAVKGYRLILTMPSSMSVERRKLLSALGAEIVLTDASEGMDGAVKMAQKLSNGIENSLLIGQFDNPANPLAHERTTAKEIIADAPNIDCFVSCVGTGGTISGIGKTLKEFNERIEVIAVEPSESPLLSQGVSGAHGIQGIGANFVPAVFDRKIIDRVETVSTAQAIDCAKLLMKTEGFTCGISSGASLFVALKQLKKGKTVLTLLPDGGEKYLSTSLFE